MRKSKKDEKIKDNIEKKLSFKEKYKKFKENMQLKSDISQLTDKWSEIMAETKTYNNMKLTLTLRHIKKESYGWSSRIYSPYGIPLEKLENLTLTIESGLKCKFIYNIPEHKQFAICKIIYPEKVKINSIPFTPVKVKPYEFCPGFDITANPIIFNLNDTPQMLIAGQQRRGKNGASDHGIINWIHSCNEKEITFYMFQGAKNDLSKYKDCKQVYCYTEKIDEMVLALQHIVDIELERRKKAFIPMIAKADGNDNVFHYNKLYPNNKMSYIIIVIDEFISLMPDDKTDSKELKNQKNIIMKYLQHIAQWGGSFGINFLILHQKPEKILMPSFLKNQSSIRICFGFEDLVCCSIVLGDELAKYAHKLPPRKAFYSNNEINDFLFTKNLKGKINQYIKESINPSHRTLFKDLDKLKKNNIIPEKQKQDIQDKPIPNEKGVAPLPIPNKKTNKKIKQESINVNFDKVDPVISNKNKEQLKNNIKNIPNFVPFNPVENMKNIKVIDKTNIINLPTEKTPKTERND